MNEEDIKQLLQKKTENKNMVDLDIKQ